VDDTGWPVSRSWSPLLRSVPLKQPRNCLAVALTTGSTTPSGHWPPAGLRSPDGARP